MEEDLGGLASEQADQGVPGHDDTHWTRATTEMDLPKGRRARGSWAMPVFGPHRERAATGAAPRRTPTTMAAMPVARPRPRAAARVPVNTPDSSMLGANQTVKFRQLAP